MPTLPSAGGLDRAVGQHVDDLALLEVDRDRPVTTPLLPGPVINPDHPQHRYFIARRDDALENCAGSCHRSVAVPGLKSGALPDDRPRHGRKAWPDLRHRHRARRTRNVTGVPRRILQPANLPAVTTGELDITYRTSSAPRAEGQNRPATVGHSDPRSWRPDPRAHLAYLIMPPSTQSAAQPSSLTHDHTK